VQSGENFASLTQLLSQFLGSLAVWPIGQLPDRPIACLAVFRLSFDLKQHENIKMPTCN